MGDPFMTGKDIRRRLARYWPRFLLVIPFLLVIWVPFYNRVEPTLAGIPFFYWYQLAAVVVGALVTLIVYLLELWITRSKPPGDSDRTGTPGEIL